MNRLSWEPAYRTSGSVEQRKSRTTPTRAPRALTRTLTGLSQRGPACYGLPARAERDAYSGRRRVPRGHPRCFLRAQKVPGVLDESSRWFVMCKAQPDVAFSCQPYACRQGNSRGPIPVAWLLRHITSSRIEGDWFSGLPQYRFLGASTPVMVRTFSVPRV